MSHNYALLKDISFHGKSNLIVPAMNLGINQDQVGNVFQNILPQQAKKLSPPPRMSFVTLKVQEQASNFVIS